MTSRRIWHRHIFRWDLSRVPAPWGGAPSIYEAIRGRSAKELRSLALPDDAKTRSESGLAWAPGARDGVGLRLMSYESVEGLLDRVLEQLRALARRSTSKRAARLYAEPPSAPASALADRLSERIAGWNPIEKDRVRAIARWLVRNAPDREPVKLGIALLGAVGGREDEGLLLSVGRHEELTLYAAMALRKSNPNPEEALWALGREVRGWGRIEIVERLAGTSNPEIRAWLIRDGCHNDIMVDYTALVCASTGRLHEALAASTVDPELREGARTILGALVRTRLGGPAPGIEAYAEAPAAVARLVTLISTGERSIEDFLFLDCLAEFLRDDDERTGSSGPAWSGVRRELGTRVRELLGSAEWKPMVVAAIEREGPDFERASIAARRLGIDVWEAHFSRLLRGEREWYEVMRTEDRNRAARVVAHAEAVLPLAEIARGPARDLGLGRAYEHHSALGFVVGNLRRFPGLGGSLVLAALRSPVTRNRNMATTALDAWPKSTWPSGAEMALRRAARDEPDETARALMETALRRATDLPASETSNDSDGARG